MPRENSPAEEPQIDSPRRAPICLSDEECDCCRGDGVPRKGYVVNELGFVLCRTCYEGRCLNCGGG